MSTWTVMLIGPGIKMEGTVEADERYLTDPFERGVRVRDLVKLGWDVDA